MRIPPPPQCERQKKEETIRVYFVCHTTPSTFVPRARNRHRRFLVAILDYYLSLQLDIAVELHTLLSLLT